MELITHTHTHTRLFLIIIVTKINYYTHLHTCTQAQHPNLFYYIPQCRSTRFLATNLPCRQKNKKKKKLKEKNPSLHLSWPGWTLSLADQHGFLGYSQLQFGILALCCVVSRNSHFAPCRNRGLKRQPIKATEEKKAIGCLHTEGN